MRALKWLKLLPVGLLVFVMGCGSPFATANYTPMPISPTEIPKPTSEVVGNPPMYSNWLSPAKVTISNFHAGAMAEYPIKFHNAKIEATEQKRVTTGDNDNFANIPLNSVGLYLDNVSSVIRVTSESANDQIKVVAYDKKANSLMMTGFASNETRIVTIVYKPMTAYSVHARLPDNVVPTESARIAQSWIVVANPTLVMSPLETAEDIVSISMPSDATLPDKQWEFWIGVSEISRSSGVGISIELVSRWVVTMRAN